MVFRVMEWLRHVDLSEYAPNLRGSGVHGALLVHEKKFTSEILAGILSIPPSKTLLRRHLSLHIKVRSVPQLQTGLILDIFSFLGSSWSGGHPSKERSRE